MARNEAWTFEHVRLAYDIDGDGIPTLIFAWAYELTPEGIKPGDRVESGMICEPKVGNAMPLESIPSGLEVHNIEMTAGQGGKKQAASQDMPRFGRHAFTGLASGKCSEHRSSLAR